jgi:hypothetical protein
MDDLRMTAAAFFRNKGKNVVTLNEFVMTVSMDLRWMMPGEAERLLALLSDHGHVKKDNEYVRPSFDVHAADIPLGFRPTAEILKRARPKRAPDGDLLAELMNIAESSGIKRKDFIVSVNAIQKRINVDIEIAALLMLRENAIDVSGYADAAYQLIAKR